MFKRIARRMAFTLVEVMVATVIIAMAAMPAIATIQMARYNARAVGLELIGQNLAGAMMELVKRSGYNEVAYGQPLPSVLSSASSINYLLELPRQAGSSTGAQQSNLPAGAPGGATTAQMNAFLTNWRGGSIDRSSTVVANSTNYLFFSANQIAALSGYSSASAIPSGKTALDAQFAWALYVSTDAAGASGGAVGYPVKHVVIVVKWRDPRRNRVQYTVAESYISQVSPRL